MEPAFAAFAEGERTPRPLQTRLQTPRTQFVHGRDPFSVPGIYPIFAGIKWFPRGFANLSGVTGDLNCERARGSPGIQMGVPGIRANLALARLAEETARASTKMPAYETYDEESFARVPQKKGRNVAVILSVVLNVVLLAGIAFVLFSGSSQLGAPMMTRTTTPSVGKLSPSCDIEASGTHLMPYSSRSRSQRCCLR
eukprot:717664-Amorphochlora_amoeboformis.AAC.2